MQFDVVSTEPLTGYAPETAIGLDVTNAQLYVSGKNLMWEPVGGGANFPVNNDITQMTALSHTAGTALLISGGIDANNAIEVTDGTHVTSWSSGGILTIESINSSGNISAGAVQAAGGLISNSIQNATPAAPIVVSNGGSGDTALLLTGTGVTEQSLLGFVNYPTQTTVGAAGGASALPATPVGFLQVKISGTYRVIPFYPIS